MNVPDPRRCLRALPRIAATMLVLALAPVVGTTSGAVHAESWLDRDDRGVRVTADADGAEDEQRVALVIGNGRYATSPLANPVNDAKSIAAVLRKLDFEVVLATNADQEDMENAIRAFGKKLKKGGVGLFYYAGHGVQVENTNYLIPIAADRQIKAKNDVRYKAVELGRVLDEFASARNRLNIVILDACRNNPFRSLWRSTASDGLAPTPAPHGTLVAYATSPGSVAADGDGKNGLYTTHLLKTLAEPGLELHEVFLDVMKDVGRATSGDQRPSFDTSVTGEFYFRRGVVSAPGMQLDDLSAQGRRRWTARLEDMKHQAAQARSYEAANNPPDLKVIAWQRFLDLYEQNNPHTKEDDTLRKEALARVKHWQGKASSWEDPNFDIEDLLDASRQRREQGVERMEVAFSDGRKTEARDLPAAVKASMWQRFIDTFSNDILGTDVDDVMRRKAAERVAHWNTTDDGERVTALDRQQIVQLELRHWEERDKEMGEVFAEAKSHEGRGLPSSVKAGIWQQFLDAYSTDNPHSRKDDEWRKKATRQVAHWKAQKDTKRPVIVVGTETDLNDPGEAGRAILQRYQEAYSGRDFGRLEGVWAMNPQQRDSMKDLFECANEVDLQVAEVGVETTPGMVYVHFDQRLRFSGPSCLMRSGEQRSKMTATVIHQGGDRWMISSILPRRER